jgi:hypothetical protein
MLNDSKFIVSQQASKNGSNWLLEKLQAEKVIQEDDEIDSDVLDESDDEVEKIDVSKQNAISREYLNDFTHSVEDPVDDHFFGIRNTNHDDDDEALNEKEEYHRFLETIWDDDDDGECNEETEDDEDYEPDFIEGTTAHLDGDEDDDADDFLIEEEVAKVNKKELRELVSECWLTIAGQQIPNEHSGSISPLLGVNKNEDDTSQPPIPRTQEQILEAIRNNTSRAISHSVLSTLVAQLFTGNKLSDLCIDGIPVGAIRKVVARQMTMALQLLLQILIQADDNSSSFSIGYNCLIELSNYRELAVRKAVLLQQNVKNVTALKHVKSDFERNKMIEEHELQRLMREVNCGQALHSSSTNDVAATMTTANRGNSSSSGTTDRNQDMPIRLTRSHILRYNAESQRSSSLFDMPILSKISEVLVQTDLAKAAVKHCVQSAATAAINTNTRFYLSGQNMTSSNPSNAITRTCTLVTMQSCAEQIQFFGTYFHVRIWYCLIPTPNYPIKGYTSMHLDYPMSTAVNRVHFTSAEDDLLLRGIVTLGEHDQWHEIQTLFVPSKDVIVLQFRYTQKTFVMTETNRFKK